MSLRARLLLIFGGIVVVSVALVSYVVSVGSRKVFQRFDEDRTRALIQQFERELQLQGDAVALQASAIARSDSVRNMAIALSGPSGDPSAYLSLAQSLASEQQLDFLDFLSGDGSIISSAEWPARFGFRESWVPATSDWNKEPAFRRYEETPQGRQLALEAVREFSEGDHRFYVVAGRRVDSSFLRNLVAPTGTKLFLWHESPANSEGVLEDSSGNVPISSELRPVLEHARSEDLTRRVRLDDSAEGEYVVHTVQLSGRGSAQPVAILVIASNRKELATLLDRIQNIGVITAIVGILLSALAARWWAGRISRPIEELSAAARDVAEGHWERKVDVPSGDDKDEVGILVAAFNQMTGELVRQRDRAVQAERVAAWRELARRLAHELKNPLFPLQITIENLTKARQQDSPEFNEIFAESTATLLAELSNLKKIVGRFSDFSKMPVPQFQKVNVNRLLEDVARLFAPQLASASKPIQLDTSLTSADTTISGDPDLLRRAFENLVLNAIDVMPEGGILRIATSIAAEALVVEISDTGAGLTEEEVSRLFTPYYTTKRHGTGLGLAIVQSVISDHGARISVASTPGKGSTFRMEFQREVSFQNTSDMFATRV